MFHWRKCLVASAARSAITTTLRVRTPLPALTLCNRRQPRTSLDDQIDSSVASPTRYSQQFLSPPAGLSFKMLSRLFIIATIATVAFAHQPGPIVLKASEWCVSMYICRYPRGADFISLG